MGFLLGIDIGTTGCKAALYDIFGNTLAQSYREYRFITPVKGYVEEDPEDWWGKTVDVIKDIIAHNDCAKKVSGIGVSCTNALIPVDCNGIALMNAVMQLDHRAVDIIANMNKIVPAKIMFEKTANRLVPGTVFAPVILWIKENRPDVYEKTHKFLAPSGFIVNKLTGRFTIDFSRASTTSLFNVNDKIWDNELIDDFQIEPDKLPEISPAQKIVGCISKQVAALTGLNEGIPVIAGVMDTVSAGIGIGSDCESEPFLIMGTIGRICLPLKNACFSDIFLNSFNTSELPYLCMAPINGAGNSIKWFRDTFGCNDTASADEYSNCDYGMLSKMASESRPGAKGLIYLPYISGERAPHWNPNAKGLFFGITVEHQKRDFVRAIMEGVAYALRNNLDIAKSFYSKDVKKLRIGGGCARSRVWTQIVADVLNVELVQTDQSDCETFGAAILAGVGVGIYPSIRAAVRETIRVTSRTIPDIGRHHEYHDYYAVFSNLYEILSEQFIQIDRLMKSGTKI